MVAGGPHGRGSGHRNRNRERPGYRYIHTAIDDRTRVAYSEVCDDERGITAAAFLARAVSWFAIRQVRVERVLTDNGPCYQSRAWAAACAAATVSTADPAPMEIRATGAAICVVARS